MPRRKSLKIAGTTIRFERSPDATAVRYGLQEECQAIHWVHDEVTRSGRLPLLEAEVMRARRAQLPLSVGMVDIENFKEINERWLLCKQETITAGIAPSRISTGSFGTRSPLCRDASENCLSLNRRVEVLASRR